MSRSFAALLAVSALALATAADAAVPTPPPPDLDAGSYIVIDHQSGDVIAQKNADQRMQPASLTKLMTTYVIFAALKDGRMKLDDPVTISEDAWRTGGSRTFVKLGSQVPVIDLIKGMIVQSGNDATVALAERVGGTREGFVQLMNEYAQRLGMKSSHFTDVDGLPDPQHYMTARDLATVANALIRDFREYYYIFSMKDFTWNHIKQPNRNGLLWSDPLSTGLKTGHTDEAGLLPHCLGQAQRHATGIGGPQSAQVALARGRQRGPAQLRLQLLPDGEDRDRAPAGSQAARLRISFRLCARRRHRRSLRDAAAGPGGPYHDRFARSPSHG